MKEEMIEAEDMANKLLVYFKKKIEVHIVLNNGSWMNGLIKEVHADFVMIDERKYGLMPVFYKEVDSVRKYIAKEDLK